jgi:DNA-binding LytR/AlgR family response regulator
MAVFVALRKLIHPLFGGHYELGDVSFELIYEYRKVTLGYSLALFSIYAFRHYVLLRRVLEMPEAATETAAIFPPEPAADLPPEPAADLPRPGTLRFLARRAHRDVLVSAADVHYLEAAGNYVILHTDQGELKLRETLSNLERELAGRDFVRVHRSYLVNLDAIREIQPWFHGDQRIVLRDGTFLNLSRRYRDALRQRTAALRQRTAALSLAADR